MQKDIGTLAMLPCEIHKVITRYYSDIEKSEYIKNINTNSIMFCYNGVGRIGIKYLQFVYCKYNSSIKKYHYCDTSIQFFLDGKRSYCATRHNEQHTFQINKDAITSLLKNNDGKVDFDILTTYNILKNTFCETLQEGYAKEQVKIQLNECVKLFTINKAEIKGLPPELIMILRHLTITYYHYLYYNAKIMDVSNIKHLHHKCNSNNPNEGQILVFDVEQLADYYVDEIDRLHLLIVEAIDKLD